MRAILAIALAFLLAAPCIALADQKKSSSSGKDTPTESVGLNYGKIEQSYQQRTINPAPKSGVNGGSATKGATRH
jgi:type VI protein secretion system component Hcp